MESELPKMNTIINEADIVNAASKTKELKPCPFCGNTTIITAGRKNERTGNIVYKAMCSSLGDCSAHMSVCIGGEDKIEESRRLVVERWNKRI